MKKISSVILTIALLACIFSGCSKTDPGTVAPDQPSTALSADTSGFQKKHEYIQRFSSAKRLQNGSRILFAKRGSFVFSKSRIQTDDARLQQAGVPAFG